MANPLLTPSPLPFQMPDFSSLQPAHYVEAVERGAAEQLAELRDVAAAPADAGFEGTFEAFERSGQLLRRAVMAFSNVKASHGTPGILEAHARIQAVLTAHRDAVHLDGELYGRLAAEDLSGVDGERDRLAAETLRAFREAGAALGEADKDRLRALNAELSALSTRYSELLLDGMNSAAVHFEDAGELEGLDDAQLESAAAAARRAGHDGGYLITLVLPTSQPLLARLERPESRRRLFEASLGRGTGAPAAGGERAVDLGARMAALRAERAGLLGFAHHADYVLAGQTAPSVDAVLERMASLAAPAMANARAEARVLAAAAGRDVEPWDWAYWSARVKRDEYALDEAALRPWFELDRLIHDGVFEAARRLYGIGFTERTDLPVYHSDVRVWEVADADGSVLGLFLGDYFARPTKAGGAWMNSIRSGASFLDELPVVTNNLNIPAPADGGPALLGLDEARTLFHEFGHALHGLFSAARYPSLAGTAVPRDFVEYPSQVNEMWLFHPGIAGHYARHHATGEPLPEGVLERIEAAALWGEGFATAEYLAAAVLDLAWHTLSPGEVVDDPLAFEDRVLREAGFDPDLVPPRYRTGYFKHVFDGGYAAGYYSYIWSEVLDADTVDWFTENGGLLRANGDTFRRELLSRGNTRDPLESYRAFRGRDADTAPLLARRGLDG
ncbi:M3 family metallopeptidase [Zafaria sp. J156]|uniref:M3 family metallopeptidase n=1 Tax=Zafaria sp. J156 TaxID=3116490 RepID=UPI002E759E54|nr:M3 family metallopeptidase [Zafaria sp. J156]MEE1621096.1 M3 family metallopeptidase [Zafaria sp. J156]